MRRYYLAEERPNDTWKKAMWDFTYDTILRHSCALIKMTDTGPEPFGSGVFVEDNGEYFLLSAGHVIRPIYENQIDLCVQIGKLKFVPISGLCVFPLGPLDHYDIGLIKLKKSVVVNLTYTYKFLPYNMVKDVEKPLRKGLYNISGSPEERTFLDDKLYFPGLYSFNSRPLKEKAYNYHRIDRKVNHFFEVVGSGIDNISGKKIEFKRLNGMSGSGVWEVITFQEPDNSYRFEYSLVAIFHTHIKSKFNGLVATRVKHIQDLWAKFRNEKIE